MDYAASECICYWLKVSQALYLIVCLYDLYAR